MNDISIHTGFGHCHACDGDTQEHTWDTETLARKTASGKPFWKRWFVCDSCGKRGKINDPDEFLKKHVQEKPIHQRNPEDFCDQELANYVMTYHRYEGLHAGKQEEYEAAGLAMLKGTRAAARAYIEKYRGRV